MRTMPLENSARLETMKEKEGGRKENKTVVIVIHDINFASCYSDYIVALKDGKLVKNGVTEETIQKEELENIYEIDFHIENINNRNICVYF